MSKPDGGVQPEVPAGVVHWIVRIAERAGLEGTRPDVSSGARAPQAWSAVTTAYGVSDHELAVLVADYFRLDVAQIERAEPNAALVIPEMMARKHHVFPMFEDDRRFVVATCDPTDVEAERALGFSTGRTTQFQVAAPAAIRRRSTSGSRPRRPWRRFWAPWRETTRTP